MNSLDPTPEEIAKVGAYWERVKALGCQHPEMRFDGAYPDTFRCADCDRPLQILSDIQIEQIANERSNHE